MKQVVTLEKMRSYTVCEIRHSPFVSAVQGKGTGIVRNFV